MTSETVISKSKISKKINQQSKEHLSEFVNDVQNKGLVLFVGSGINGDAIVQWNDLLCSLLKKSLQRIEYEDSRIQDHNKKLVQWCSQNFGMSAQASITKKMFGTERYRLEIQEALYTKTKNVEQEVIKYCKNPAPYSSKYSFLHQIANLCSLPQTKAVATFNFDTLLEQAIKTVGTRKPQPHFGEIDSTRHSERRLDDIPIYHIHGRIPSPSLFKDSGESVVLSYDEYFEKNADPLSWETATSIHLLRNYCTLWLGTSLKDWNMLRLLHGAQSGRKNIRSYCILCLDDIKVPKEFGMKEDEKTDFKKAAMRVQASLLESVGVRLILGGKRYPDIPKTIEHFIFNPLKTK
jgi:hypothetical protein